MFDLQTNGKLRKVKDEPRISPDGIPYRAREWRHVDGHKIEVNSDAFGHHARVDGKYTAVNLDEGGLVNFILRIFGR